MAYWSETYRPVLWWLGISSIVLFLAFLIGIPLIIIRMPSDFFQRIGLPRAQARPLTRKRAVGLVIKHLVGLIFLVAGIVMLVLPGQGILSIIIGLSLVYFPGKRRFILAIVSRPRIWKTLNRIRLKFNQPKLMKP